MMTMIHIIEMLSCKNTIHLCGYKRSCWRQIRTSAPRQDLSMDFIRFINNNSISLDCIFIPLYIAWRRQQGKRKSLLLKRNFFEDETLIPDTPQTLTRKQIKLLDFHINNNKYITYHSASHHSKSTHIQTHKTSSIQTHAQYFKDDILLLLLKEERKSPSALNHRTNCNYY